MALALLLSKPRTCPQSPPPGGTPTHLLVTYLPTVQHSRLVNSLKGVSSRRLRQEFPELARHY